MRKSAVLFAVAGTLFLALILPFMLGPFAPNGTETLALIALLWVASWFLSRRQIKRSGSVRQG